VKPMEKKKILNEIYKTEKSYLHHLVLLKTLFLEPLKISSVLPVRHIDGIFSNIEAIYQVSAHLLELMESEGVIHALLNLAPYLKLYSLYANNFNTSNKLLEECLKNYPDFHRLVSFQETREEMQCLKLSALLVTPIQRVPRYRLLVETLLAKTPADAIDFKKLKDAYNKLNEIAIHINECVRQHENFMTMLGIQNRFSGNQRPQIIAPGRKFLKEGNLTKITTSGHVKLRKVYLFNDILLVAKCESNGLLSCREIFELNDSIFESVLGNTSNGNGVFRMIDKKKSLVLCCMEETNSWASDIKNAIQNVHCTSNRFISIENGEKKRIFLNGAKTRESQKSEKMLKRQTVLESKSTSSIIASNAANNNNNISSDANHYYHKNDTIDSTITSMWLHNNTDSAVFESGQPSVAIENSNVNNGSGTAAVKQHWSLSFSSGIENRPSIRSLRGSIQQIISCSPSKRKRKTSEASIVQEKKQKTIHNDSNNYGTGIGENQKDQSYSSCRVM